MITIDAVHWSYHGGGNSFEIVPGNALESVKIGSVAGINMRPVIVGMAIGFVLVCSEKSNAAYTAMAAAMSAMCRERSRWARARS